MHRRRYLKVGATTLKMLALLQQENRKPYDEYHAKKQHLVSKLQQAKFGQQQEEQARINVLSEGEPFN